MKVFIYGLCDVFYDSFYIQRITEVCKNYSFNISKFPDFRQRTFAVILEYNNIQKKIIIDSNDGSFYDEKALEWCDVYGKVNYNFKDILCEKNSKIIAIGPSFGIKIWNFFQTISIEGFNFLRFYNRINNKREYVANYFRQYKRLSLKEYIPKNSSSHYVFFMSSIWKNEPKTNELRQEFIKTCKAIINITFEGGFAKRTDGDNFGFDQFVIDKRADQKTYVQKIQKSAFVFNTPAVLSCHGWKLAEFLALGKAIISTKHVNTLPLELEDNKHLINVNQKNMMEKCQLIVSDSVLKQNLEKNARQYFLSVLAPAVVIKKLIAFK